MLNIEKVKSMTKAAAYESGPEKKNIEISDYFRTDYLGLHMVKSGIAYAVSFVIIAAIWFMGKTEDVMNIIELEQPLGVIASLGGQTAINLAAPLNKRGVKIIGTDCTAIDKAENRDSFEKLLVELDIPQPKGMAVTNIEDGISAAAEIGYPVLVRPSFVLGGRAMQIVANEKMLRHYLKTAVEIDCDKPVLVDKYIKGKEKNRKSILHFYGK